MSAVREWEVPVTIADERLVTVRARSKDEAIAKLMEGKYVRLGLSLSRGFLVYGEPRVRA